MSRLQLHRLVARATGESRRMIRSLGFNLVRLDVPIPPPAPHLCLCCPGCGEDVPLRSQAGRLPEFAECKTCDISYPYSENEVFLPETVIGGCS